MEIRQYLNDWWQGKPERGKRSGKWPKVRDEHLKEHPFCEACGGTDNLQVHHIVPVSHGGPELEPPNLMTLCTDGPAGTNCHYIFGHSADWKARNSNAKVDAKVFRDRLRTREYPHETQNR